MVLGGKVGKCIDVHVWEIISSRDIILLDTGNGSTQLLALISPNGRHHVPMVQYPHPQVGITSHYLGNGLRTELDTDNDTFYIPIGTNFLLKNLAAQWLSSQPPYAFVVQFWDWSLPCSFGAVRTRKSPDYGMCTGPSLRPRNLRIFKVCKSDFLLIY